MKRNDNNLQGIYNTLKQEGYNPPAYEDFVNDMTDDSNLQDVHNTLKKHGYEPPEFDVFKSDMFGSDSQQEAIQSSGGNAPGGSPGSPSWWTDVNAESPLNTYMQGEKPTAEVKPQEAWKPTEKQKVEMARQLDKAQARTDAMLAENREQMDNVAEYYRNNSSLGFQTVEGKPVVNPQTGELEKTYLTPTGERMKSKSDADMATANFRQAMAAADMSVGAQIRRAEAELSELRRQLDSSSARVEKEWAEDYEKNSAPLASVLATNTYVPRQVSDKENSALRVAIRQREEQLKNLYEERDRQVGKDVGFWRGIGRTVSDSRTWDFGAGDLMDNVTMMNLDKYQSADATEGEKKAGQAMMKAIYDRQETEQMYGGNASFWNRAGVMTGYMPSFMLDFALTGSGFEALNVVGKAATRGAAKVIGKNAIKEMAELGVKEYAKKYGVRGMGKMAGNWTIKALGTTADDLLIRAPLMTNTIQAGKTAADIIDRKLGDVTVDENGNYDFTNDKTWGSAVWQGEANAIIENYSEMFGAHLDGIAPELVKVFGGKRISGMLARANASSFGQIYNTTRKQFERMGVSDYLGEVGEEYYGQLWRTMLNLDDAYRQNPDGSRTNLFHDDQFRADIWGGMALSMGLMGIGKYSITGIAYTGMKHQVNKADRIAAQVFTPGKWESIRELIDSTTNEDMCAVAESIVGDNTLSDKEIAAAMTYMERSLNLRGLNLGTMAQSRGAQTDPIEQELNQSYIDGYEASTPQEMNDAKNMLDLHRQRLAAALSEDVVPEFDEDPIGALLRTADPELRLIALDYVNAKQVYDGIIHRVNDDIDEQIVQSDAMIDARVNPANGMIQPAVMGVDDRQVYVVGGTLAVNPDGTIDRGASDESIVIRDVSTGEVEFADPKSIASVGEAIDPEVEKATAAETIRQQAAQAAADAINGTLSFTPGDVVQINDGGGVADVTIVGPAVDEKSGMPVDGQIIVQFPNSQQTAFTKEQLQAFADAANLERLNAFEQERAAQRGQQQAIEAEAVQSSIPENAETVPNIEENPIAEVENEPEAVSNELQPETALSRVPLDEKTGEPILTHESVDAETGWDAAVEFFGGEDDALKYVQSAVAMTETEISKARKAEENVKPTGGMAKYRDDLKAARDKVAQARGVLERWRAIEDTPKRRLQEQRAALEAERRAQNERTQAKWRQEAEERRREAEEQARLKAEEEARIEAQRQEQERERNRPENLRKSQAADAFEQWVEEQMKPQFDEATVQRHKREDAAQGGVQYGRSYAEWDSPSSLDEWVARRLSTSSVRIQWSGRDNLAGEIMGRPDVSEKKEYRWLLSDSTGVPFTTYIHQMWETLMGDDSVAFNKSDISDHDVRNAVIDMLRSNPTSRSLYEVALDQQRQREQERAMMESGMHMLDEEELRERWYQESFHLSPAEFEAMEEAVQQQMEEMAVNVSEVEQIINEESNEYERRYDGIAAESGGIVEGVQRGAEVLPGQQVDDSAGSETASAGINVKADGTNNPESSPASEGSAETVAEGDKKSGSLGERIAAAEAEVNTNPTDGQKEAGNYKKGHVQVGTFNVTIEQPVGSVRRGTDADGKEWETTMQNTYGYIRGTQSVDGDHIDVFLSNDIDGWNGRKVFVVDQYNPDGTFDEHKVMLGFNDMEEAKEAYLANYEDGWENGRRLVFSSANLEDFEKWIDSSHRKQKPYHEYKIADKAEVIESDPAQNNVQDSETSNIAEEANDVFPEKEASKLSDDVRGQVEVFLSKFHSGPIRVLRDARDIEALDLPAEVKEELVADLESGKVPGGFCQVDKNIYIFAGQNDARRIKGTLTHENIHYVVDRFGAESDDFMESYMNEVSESGIMDGMFERVLSAIREQYLEETVSEEFLAYTLEKGLRKEIYLDEIMSALTDETRHSLETLILSNLYRNNNERNEKMGGNDSRRTGRISQVGGLSQVYPRVRPEGGLHSSNDGAIRRGGRGGRGNSESGASDEITGTNSPQTGDPISDKAWGEMDATERMAVAERAPLTQQEIEDANVDTTIRANALAYLSGRRGIIQTISYLDVYSHVRNLNGDSRTDSGDRDVAQLVSTSSEVNNTGGAGDGSRGASVSVDNGTDGENRAESADGRKNSPGDSRITSGASGNSHISEDAPTVGTVSSDSDITSGSSKSGGQRGDGRRRGRSRRADSAAKDAAGNTETGFIADGKSGEVNDLSKAGDSLSLTEQEAATGRTSVEDGLGSAIDEFKSILDEFVKAGKKSLSLSLVGMNSDQIEILPKVISAGAKIGYELIRKGFATLGQWRENMRRYLSTPLRHAGISESEVDAWITEMWDCDFTIDGTTRRISEWAAIYDQKRLHKAVESTLDEKRRAQTEAEGTEVKVGDVENIRETLPFLLPQQHEDVRRAEVQFFDESHSDAEHGNGKGYMFTNGTGTGKTYTGLGIVKRFVKQGKGRVLILTPSQPKVNDWINDGANLQLPIRSLEDWAAERGTTATNEKGDGVVITTYANFRQNKALEEDCFDLIVYDESHRLLENKRGEATAAVSAHYRISNKNESDTSERLRNVNKVYQALNKARDEFQDLYSKTVDKAKQTSGYDNLFHLQTNGLVPPLFQEEWSTAMIQKFPKLAELRQKCLELERKFNEEERPRIEEQTKKDMARTKVVFLSATPFNTRENIDYAEGYIFSYPKEDSGSYMVPHGRSRFFLDHFGAGYKWRYHRLENSTENAQALAQQEVEFSDWLQNGLQTMSGRVIDSEYDYSRDFPTVTGEYAMRFNEATSELSRNRYTSMAYHETIGNYNYGQALFESLKVSQIIPRIREHLAMGRKVAVYHRRVETVQPLDKPFAYLFNTAMTHAHEMKDPEEAKKAKSEVRRLHRKYSDMLEWEKSLDLRMPRQQLADAFGEDNIGFFGGKESTKIKNKAVADFNSDEGGKNLIVVQEASGKEGISLHDRSGKHQRVIITLALPQSPITALQIEGRIFRIGNRSNAIFEYPLLGLDSEMILFGQTFNNQVGTTENLALGSQARNLRESFARGIEERSGDVSLVSQGFGGKEFDSQDKMNGADPFERSVLDYYTNHKLSGRRDAREGKDYYPTPEPLGYMMTQWGQISDGESVLEPSAGHGAIARYVPVSNTLTAIEPSSELFSRLQLKAGGMGRKFENQIFENYNTVNKHDVVLMNPPFGTAGRLAVDHLAKAFGHLEEGGRIVAIIPRGSTDKKFDSWYNSENKAVLTGEVLLPNVTFERAGTSVSCRVVVVDKVSNRELAAKASSGAMYYDLSNENYSRIEDFFEAVRNVDMPQRTIDTNARMRKRSLPSARSLREIKGIKEVKVTDEMIRVNGRGVWETINWGDTSPAQLPAMLKERFERYAMRADSALERDDLQTHEIYSELKKLCARLADKTEEEMSRVEKSSDDTLSRQGDGYGAYSDAEVSYLNDPISKVMGKNRFSKKRQAEFAMRERQRMVDRVKALAEKLHLNNVEIVMDASQLEGKRAKAKGFFNKSTGKITIVIPNNLNTLDIEQTLLHEAVAHYGLRKLLGKQFDTFLDNVYQSADEEIRHKISEMAAKNGWNFRTATEEYLATLAEDTEFENNRSAYGWWSMVKSLFLDMLEKIGFAGFRDKTGVVLTDNELRYLLWRSYHNLATPGGLRGILGEAADVAKQYELKVGNYAEQGIEAEYATEGELNYDNDIFNSQLQLYIEGKLNRQEPLLLGMPKGVMKIFLPSTSIIMRQRILHKASEKKHNVALDALMNMPAHISKPIFVFQRFENTIGILTEMKDRDGKNVCVAIEMNKEMQDGKEVLMVNDIRSVHGREARNIIEPILQNGTLKYADKEKGLEWLSSASSSYQQEIAKQDLNSAAKLIENFENPAIEDDVLFRPGDFSPRDKVMARDTYNRVCASGSYQFKEAVQDSMLGLKELYNAIQPDKRIEEVAGFENAYLFENRMSSMNAAEQHEYFQRYMCPLLVEIGRIVKADSRKRKELTDYLMAKHGLERNEYMRNEAAANGEDTDRDFAGLVGLTGESDWQSAESTARQWVDDYEAMVDTTQLWDAINKATKASLEKVYLSGILSKEAYEKIRDMYQYYVPLRGWDETTSDQVYGYLTSNNGPLRGGIMKKAEGRESMADDPIATIGMMADDAIRQGNRNIMKQRFLNFVLNHPSDAVSVHDIWLEYDEAHDEWKPVFADVKPTDTADEVAQNVEAFEQRMEALKNADPDKYKRGREAQQIPYKVVKGNLKEHQILIKRNGRTFVVTINGNPRAAQAINGLTNPDTDQNDAIGNLLKAGTWVNRQLSAFYTTRNPDFVVGNFFRDMLYSNCMTWVKESPRYALRFHKNFALANPAVMRQLLGKWDAGTLNMSDNLEKLFYQFMKNGGETGYTSVRDIESHKKAIIAELKKQGSTGRKAWALLGQQLDLLNRSAENCARFAAFVTSREFGRSIDRSIYDAKEVSVNFNKKGSGGKMVNANGQTALGKTGAYLSGFGRALFVFWNAGIQGMTNFGRQAKLHPAKFSAGATALFTLGYVIPLLAQMLGGGDGDDDDKNAYYNLPEYVRRSNICFYAGDQWITIPLPIEYRAMYGMGELAHGVISGNERYSNSELAYQMASQVSQLLPLDMLEGGGGLTPFIPSAAKPYTEAYILNKGWTGLPVYKETPFNKNDPEWTKAYANTDKHLVDFAKWLNETSGGDDFKKGSIDINPAKIEYLLNGTFGGLFTFPNKLKKTGETFIWGDRDFEWRNMPIFNRLIKSGDDRTANRKLQNEYFKYKKEYDETRRLLRKYQNAEDQGIMGYAEKINFLENSPEYLRYEIFDEFKPDLDAYREAISAEADKEERARLEAEMHAVMRALIDTLHHPETKDNSKQE